MNGVELGASGICGVLLPLAVSLLKSVNWDRPRKLALCIGLSLVIAVIISAVTSGPGWSILSNWGVVFGTASTVYATLLEKSGLEEKLRDTLVK